MACALPQGGEFVFVLLTVPVSGAILTADQAAFVTLFVTLSMLTIPILFWAEEKFIAPLFARPVDLPFDPVSARNKVIICGFGRIGQIVGRVLRLKRIPFTALDKNHDQIMLVRRFGATAYFGDSSRLEMLRAAGANEAKILVIALEDIEESLTVADHARRHFPHLKVLARARNRRHAYLLMDRGVEHVVRETFYSSLKLTEMVLREEGIREHEVQHVVRFFEEQDEHLLRDQHSFYEDEKQLIQSNKQVTEELRKLLEADPPPVAPPGEHRIDHLGQHGDEHAIGCIFYGLFMDEELLRQKGVTPTNIRLGHVVDVGIRIGERATLVPQAGGCVHGVVAGLTHAELQVLYAELPDYGPEAVTVNVQDGRSIPALCFNLVTPFEPGRSNSRYAGRLRELARRL